MRTPIEKALIIAIRTGDAASRTVYADWLEEQGHPLRAALLRDPRPLNSVVADLAQWVSEVLNEDYYSAAPGRSFRALSTHDSVMPGQEASVSIMYYCNHPLRPTQLLVPDEVAAHFEISDFRIGNRSQFEQPGPIPCTSLTAAAFAMHKGLFCFATAQPGMDVTLSVKNTGPLPQRFTCLLFGISPAMESSGDQQHRREIQLLGAWESIVSPKPR